MESGLRKAARLRSGREGELKPHRFHSPENCRCCTRRVAAGFASDITAYRSEFGCTVGTATGVAGGKGGLLPTAIAAGDFLQRTSESRVIHSQSMLGPAIASEVVQLPYSQRGATTKPKFKTIWEPVHYQEDLLVFDIF